MTTDELIQERHKTHGDFPANARLSQSMKEMFRDEPGWATLSNSRREALDMIALKLSRILSGKAHEADHWDDIAGYAKLASRTDFARVDAPCSAPVRASRKAWLDYIDRNSL
jgi:hypothetical protein